jgi:hypothetical protein
MPRNTGAIIEFTPIINDRNPKDIKMKYRMLKYARSTIRIYGGTVEFHTWFGGINSGAGGKSYSTLSDLNQNMLSEPFRIGIQSANPPIIMKTTPNANEYLSMKTTILLGFMSFFLPSRIMKNNITKKATAIAPKVITLFIQRFSGFTVYSPSICKPTSQPTAISVTPKIIL